MSGRHSPWPLQGGSYSVRDVSEGASISPVNTAKSLASFFTLTGYAKFSHKLQADPLSMARILN